MTVKPEIVVTHRVFPETIELLEKAGRVFAPSGEDRLSLSTICEHQGTIKAMMAFMPDSVDAEFLEKCPELKIVACALKGYDNFDADACRERAIWLSIVPDLLTVPTAELTIGLMIGLARNLRAGDELVRSGGFRGWRPTLYGTGLAGRSVGLVGMGAIGRAIAERLRAFGVTLAYFDERRLDGALEATFGATFFDLERLLASSDYVVNCLPLTPRTHHFLDAARIASIKKGAFLINPARGSVVDEGEVLDALKSDRIGGYAADVFEMEDWTRKDRPLSINPELLHHPNTFFTPHLGSAVSDVRRAIERRAAENILDVLGGLSPRDAVFQLPNQERNSSLH
ncbi:MAG: phosphonate dehydrogenase [Leptospirales bacterium]